MEAKEYARLFGAFSTEKRVNIVSALLRAGPEGTSLIELSRETGLSVIEIGNTAEALLMMNLIKISMKGENKLISANFTLMDALFQEAFDEFGPGRALKPEPAPE